MADMALRGTEEDTGGGTSAVVDRKSAHTSEVVDACSKFWGCFLSRTNRCTPQHLVSSNCSLDSARVGNHLGFVWARPIAGCTTPPCTYDVVL